MAAAPVAQTSLHGSGLVADTGVDNAAVVPALVAGNAVFFLHQKQAKMGEATRDFERDAEPYYTRPMMITLYRESVTVSEKNC